MIHLPRVIRSFVRSSKLSAVRTLATLMLLTGGAQVAKAQLSVAVGTTSATQIATVTINTAGQTASTTATAIPVLTQGAAGLDFNFVSGGTCALSHSYAAKAACTVEYTFKPKYSGVRYGAVQLKSSAGVVLGTAFISGTGTGPQAIFPSATMTTLPGTYNQPRNMAIDGAGNIYVSNFGAGTVVEIPAGCVTTSCMTTVGGGFSGPAFVAVDGAGSIYVADFTASVVNEMPAGCASASCVTQLGDGFYQPISVRVDGSGNVFVADFGNSAVKKIPPACTTSDCVVQLGSGFLNPQDVALDGSGNIYVADYGNNLVKSMPASCSNTNCTVTTLGGGFNSPSGVAVDGNGNVYVGDAGNNAVKVMTPGCTPANASTCVTTISNTFNAPIGVTLSEGGDLFVADNGNNAIQEFPRATAPSITFPKVNDGATATAQVVTLANYGNQPLAITVPSLGVNPSVSSGYTLATTGTGACPSVSAGGTAATLAANASCTLTINFAPVFPDSGTFTGSVILTDNNANVAALSQMIALSGTAAAIVPIITSISPTDGLPAGGTTVTINGSSLAAVTAVHFGSTTATSFHLMSDTQMTAVSPAEAVAVVDIQATDAEGQSLKSAGDQFTYTNSLLNTITFPALASVSLGSTPPTPAASATSGQPVTYTTSTPTICTISGKSITNLSVGTCTITASQGATGNYAAAVPVSQSFEVIPIGNLVGVTSATQTATLTFTAAVASGTTLTINVLTQGAPNLDFKFVSGGTCTSGKAYAVGATCSVNYSFTPTHPYIRHGAITLTTAAAGNVARTYINGVGTGPQVSFPRISGYGTDVPLGAGTVLNSVRPYGVAVDGNGNVFFPDIESGEIYEIFAVNGTVSTGSASATLTGGGLTEPTSIAVDGAGDVFYGQINPGHVYELVSVNGVVQPGTVPLQVGGSFQHPSGLAVDGNGNVSVVDANGLSVVVAVNGVVNSSSSVTTFGQLQGDVQGVAVDGNGNLFVSTESGNVYEVVAVNGAVTATSTIEKIITGVGGFGIAVDGGGNLYLDNEGENIQEVFAVGGVVNSTSQVKTISTGYGTAEGLAVDASGNIFVTNFAGPPREIGVVVPYVVNFPTSTLQGTTDSTDGTETVTLLNSGNAPLSFAIPGSGTNPNKAADFTFTSGGNGVCPVLTPGTSPEATLAAGASCTIPLTFTPRASTFGAVTESMTFTDNNLYNGNGTGTGGIPATASQTITLTGSANVVATTPVLTVAAISADYGSADTDLRATLAYSGPAAPTGALTFQVGSGTIDTATCTGTASPLSCDDFYNTYLLAPGTYTITASLAADSNYLATSATGTLTITGNSTLTASVGSTSSVQTAIVTMTTAGTVGAIDVLTTGQPNLDYVLAAGGTCAVGKAYAVNATCTVNYTLTPRAPGVRSGAVELVASGGASVLGTQMISGTGTGPAVTFPASLTSTTLGSGFVNPYSMAVDAAGNVFVADFTNNAVKEIVAVNGSIPANPTIRTLGSGFSNPTGVAVDGAGNIYVADFGNVALKEMVAVGGVIPSNPTIVANYNFNGPIGVAVDGVGNVYISDAQDGILEIEAGTASNTIAELNGTFNNPQGIAVDGAGNVFVADVGTNLVSEIVAASGNVVTLGTFNQPNWVALDAAGDVYVADGASKAVYELVAVNGGIPASNVQRLTLGSGFNMPTGVALDNAGNIYVADYGLNRIREIHTATAPSIAFASTNVNSTSASQNVSLQNIGNVSLTLPVPGSGTNPALTSGFTLNASPSACPLVSAGGSAGTLAQGAVCTEAVSFAPVNAGPASGSLTFTDNALNVSSATQVISLSGTAVGNPTVTAVSPSSGSIVGGTIVTITGTNFLAGATVSFGGVFATNITVVSATSITASVPAQSAGAVDVTVTTSDGTSTTNASDTFTYVALTNTITFPALADTPLGAPAPVLNATATSGQAITYTVFPPSVCTLAKSVLTDVGAGNCTVVADQNGGGQYSSARPVTRMYNVTAIPFVFVGGSGSVESFNNYGSKASAAVAGGGIGAAVDAAGYVWSIDSSGSGVSRFSPSAGALANDYTGIGLSSATALAIDGSGQVWIANASGTVSMLTNAGAPAATIHDPSFSGTTSIAIDISGTVWVTNATNNTVDEIVGGAAPTAPLATAVQNNTPGTRP